MCKKDKINFPKLNSVIKTSWLPMDYYVNTHYAFSYFLNILLLLTSFVFRSNVFLIVSFEPFKIGFENIHTTGGLYTKRQFLPYLTYM